MQKLCSPTVGVDEYAHQAAAFTCHVSHLCKCGRPGDAWPDIHVQLVEGRWLRIRHLSANSTQHPASATMDRPTGRLLNERLHMPSKKGRTQQLNGRSMYSIGICQASRALSDHVVVHGSVEDILITCSWQRTGPARLWWHCGSAGRRRLWRPHLPPNFSRASTPPRPGAAVVVAWCACCQVVHGQRIIELKLTACSAPGIGSAIYVTWLMTVKPTFADSGRSLA